MKKQTLIYLFLLFGGFFNFSYPYVFQFKQKVGDQYRIVASSIQHAYLNNRKIASYDQGYKAILRVSEIQDEKAKITGKYYYMSKPFGSKDSYQIHEDRIYDSEFYRDSTGKIEIGDTFFYPVVRDLPVFPKKDMQIGETWVGTGMESQDFRKMGIAKPFITPFQVNYQYLKDAQHNGKNCAVVSIFYYMDNRFQLGLNPNTRQHRYPVRVMGFFKGHFYWDKEKNEMSAYDGDYSFIYIMSNGEIREWDGKDQGEVVIVRENKENEEKIKEEAKKEIGEIGEVTEEAEGIKLTFSDILFDTNKANLKSEILPSLEKVVEILKKYPQYEVRVEGHSDNAGTEVVKTRIALARAKSVANFLIQKEIDSKRVSYAGFSDKKPIASNNTEEGKAKNRRVEIYIITK